MSKFDLTEDEKDCLQELINVSYGTASASISEILNSFATLNIPQIKLIESFELKNYLVENNKSNTSQYIVSQLIHGSLSGENIFIVDENSAIAMTKVFNEEDEVSTEDVSDVVLEITNILSSATVGKFSELLESKVSFQAPALEIIKSMNDFNDKRVEEFSKVIIISTVLEFRDLNITGELILLTKDESIDRLKEELARILDEF